jgi:hypothetical protein
MRGDHRFPGRVALVAEQQFWFSLCGLAGYGPRGEPAWENAPGEDAVTERIGFVAPLQVVVGLGQHSVEML